MRLAHVTEVISLVLFLSVQAITALPQADSDQCPDYSNKVLISRPWYKSFGMGSGSLAQIIEPSMLRIHIDTRQIQLFNFTIYFLIWNAEDYIEFAHSLIPDSSFLETSSDSESAEPVKISLCNVFDHSTDHGERCKGASSNSSDQASKWYSNNKHGDTDILTKYSILNEAVTVNYTESKTPGVFDKVIKIPHIDLTGLIGMVFAIEPLAHVENRLQATKKFTKGRNDHTYKNTILLTPTASAIYASQNFTSSFHRNIDNATLLNDIESPSFQITSPIQLPLNVISWVDSSDSSLPSTFDPLIYEYVERWVFLAIGLWCLVCSFIPFLFFKIEDTNRSGSLIGVITELPIKVFIMWSFSFGYRSYLSRGRDVLKSERIFDAPHIVITIGEVWCTKALEDQLNLTISTFFPPENAAVGDVELMEIGNAGRLGDQNNVVVVDRVKSMEEVDRVLCSIDTFTLLVSVIVAGLTLLTTRQVKSSTALLTSICWSSIDLLSFSIALKLILVSIYHVRYSVSKRHINPAKNFHWFVFAVVFLAVCLFIFLFGLSISIDLKDIETLDESWLMEQGEASDSVLTKIYVRRHIIRYLYIPCIHTLLTICMLSLMIFERETRPSLRDSPGEPFSKFGRYIGVILIHSLRFPYYFLKDPCLSIWSFLKEFGSDTKSQVISWIFSKILTNFFINLQVDHVKNITNKADNTDNVVDDDGYTNYNNQSNMSNKSNMSSKSKKNKKKSKVKRRRS